MVKKVMYMDRKTRIMEIISSSDKPVSASKIAKELGVSRQIIVGDVALLRAWEKILLLHLEDIY